MNDKDTNFDLVLDEIGDFGRYQQTNFLLLSLPVIFAAANSLSYVFTAGNPNYRCLVPECENPQQPVYDEPWVHHAVPGTTVAGIFQPEHCLRFVIESTSNSSTPSNECPAEWFSDQKIGCNEWVFDPNERTIVNDWKITCPENLWRLALIGTLHFSGIVVGSGLFGFLADKYGRRLVFIFCILFMSVTGIGQALSKDYITFSVFAFLNAVGTSGVYPLAFIIGVEMVGARKREMSGVVLNYFYAVGEALVGAIAWWCTDWVTVQYAVAAPPLIFALYYWIIPESIRWLLARGETAKAAKIIKKAAKVNGIALSDSIIKNFSLHAPTTANGHVNDDCKGIDTVELEKQKLKYEVWNNVKQMLRSRKMILRCVFLFYIWATNAFVFYGLSLNSQNLSGNKYLNFILVCLIEIPGLTLAWIAMNKLGRRISLSGSLLICGVTCVCGGFVTPDLHWLLILLFLTGKMGITASFTIVYVHTAEMLPTIIRSGGVGTMSTVARVGALLAPFVPLLDTVYKPLPLLLFGSVSFVGGILAILLPETLGEKLPDTVEEAERLGEKRDDNIAMIGISSVAS